MQEMTMITSMVTAMWLTVAILAGGLARTRNRSAWAWFLMTVLLGPIAAFLLVVWPVAPSKQVALSTTP